MKLRLRALSTQQKGDVAEMGTVGSVYAKGAKAPLAGKSQIAGRVFLAKRWVGMHVVYSSMNETVQVSLGRARRERRAQPIEAYSATRPDKRPSRTPVMVVATTLPTACSVSKLTSANCSVRPMSGLSIKTRWARPTCA